MKNVVLFVLITLFLGISNAFSAHIIIYGKGGASGGDKTNIEICPDESDAKCCEIEVDLNDLELRTEEQYYVEAKGSVRIPKDDGTTGVFSFNALEFKVIECDRPRVGVDDAILYGTFNE